MLVHAAIRRPVAGLPITLTPLALALLLVLIRAVEQFLEHLRKRLALELVVHEWRHLGRSLDELELRVQLLDESVDHVVSGHVGMARVLLEQVDIVRQHAVLEGHVEVLVQHEVAQLLAREAVDELLTVDLVAAVGVGRGHAGLDLRLAHADDARQQCELVVPHGVDVGSLNALRWRHFFP